MVCKFAELEWMLVCDRIKIKVEVCSLVSSTKCHSPDFKQLPPGHWTSLFISRLNSRGEHTAQLPCWGSMKLFKHASLHCPTRYPLTPGLRECTCEQSVLPRSTTPEHIQRSWGSNPPSLGCTLCMLPLSHDAAHI